MRTFDFKFSIKRLPGEVYSVRKRVVPYLHFTCKMVKLNISFILLCNIAKFYSTTGFTYVLTND